MHVASVDHRNLWLNPEYFWDTLKYIQHTLLHFNNVFHSSIKFNLEDNISNSNLYINTSFYIHIKNKIQTAQNSELYLFPVIYNVIEI